MEHKTIKLPREMLNEVEKFIKNNPQLGYTSTTEFIKEWIRIALREKAKKK